MPGMRPRGFWVGGAALFAQFMLGRLAFTTAVARPDDVGIDFLCTLITTADAKMLRPGPFFTVQVKNKSAPIRYERDYEIDWVWHQDPFFICVSNLSELTIDLYSTWQLLKATLIRKDDNLRPPVVLESGRRPRSLRDKRDACSRIDPHERSPVLGDRGDPGVSEELRSRSDDPASLDESRPM